MGCQTRPPKPTFFRLSDLRGDGGCIRGRVDNRASQNLGLLGYAGERLGSIMYPGEYKAGSPGYCRLGRYLGTYLAPATHSRRFGHHFAFVLRCTRQMRVGGEKAPTISATVSRDAKL